MKTVAFLFMFFVFFSTKSIHANDLYLYSNISGENKFLGCLTCNDFASDSICNEFSIYGNSYSSESIFNEYSQFGNSFSSDSPWNEFSSSSQVPYVVNRRGEFYGFFTINIHRHNAFAAATGLKRIYDSANGNLETVQHLICNK